MAQDMAFGGGLRKSFSKNFDPTGPRVAYASGRTKDSYRRTRRSVCQEHVGSCSGPQAKGSGNDANVSALTKEWNLKIVALEKEIPFVNPSNFRFQPLVFRGCILNKHNIFQVVQISDPTCHQLSSQSPPHASHPEDLKVSDAGDLRFI